MYVWLTSLGLPSGGFQWVEEASQLTKDFIKIYNEDSDLGYFIKDDVQYPEKLHELSFFLEEAKLKLLEKIVGYLHHKKK